MKKNLLTAAVALAFGASVAQTPFLEKTCYRGAFAPAPTPMWTDGWTEWNPKAKVYPAPTVTISANITTNTTWTTGQTYLLQGPIYVTNSAVLTIQPGVVVRGSSQIAGSGLFITTGSKLMAVGNATAPIVFTSDNDPGSRSVGDWGGVILMGLASNNNANGINNIEGIAATSLTQYGGGTSPNDDDNSGDLEYVRIEFGGYVYAPNKEINGLTFGAVGRGTTIDHVQCSYINDDAFEWFGGTVRCKHLIAYRCVDDDFDTDNGFRGVVQFGLGVRDPELADPTYNQSGGSTSEGFESDNDASGSTNLPQTQAIFCNMTDIGPLRGASTNTTHPGFARGARIRRNSALRIINSILVDHKTRGVYIDGALSEGNANSGSLLFSHNIVAGYGVRATETGTFGVLTSPNTWIASTNDTNKVSTSNGQSLYMVNPYNFTSPDYRPKPGSIALTGADFSDALISPSVTASNASVTVAAPTNTFCVDATHPATFAITPSINGDYCSLGWNVQTGVSISNTTDVVPSFSISTPGTFSITLVITNANGTQSVTSSISTNTCLNVSVKESAGVIGSVNLFPNPASNAVVVSINANRASALAVSIFDITGKLVAAPVANQSLIAGSNKFEINTSDLNNGIYFVTLNTDNGKETVKLIVNK